MKRKILIIYVLFLLFVVFSNKVNAFDTDEMQEQGLHYYYNEEKACYQLDLDNYNKVQYVPGSILFFNQENVIINLKGTSKIENTYHGPTFDIQGNNITIIGDGELHLEGNNGIKATKLTIESGNIYTNNTTEYPNTDGFIISNFIMNGGNVNISSKYSGISCWGATPDVKPNVSINGGTLEINITGENGKVFRNGVNFENMEKKYLINAGADKNNFSEIQLADVSNDNGTYKYLKIELSNNQSTDEGEEIGLKFELNEDGKTYKVSGFSGQKEREVIIPEIYNGLPVTEIGKEAFYRVYADYNLEKITLPETITKIGDSAFANCQKLKSLNIPKSVVSIGYNAFFDCKVLNNIVLPNITVIEEATFWNCESLEEIVIPDTVTKIKSYAFDGCKSLTKITIPDSVTELGETFEHTKEGAVFSECISLKNVVLSKNIKNIHYNMFASCTSLEELVIPEGVETIASSSIFRCINLKKLVLPRSFNKLFDGDFAEDNINPTIYGYNGSYAEEFAATYGFEFVPREELTTVNTQEVTVNNEKVSVMPVKNSTDVKDFINETNFPVLNTYTITVYDANGSEKTNTEKIGSKNIIKIENNIGEILAEYIVIVPGDVTGNGEVKMYDAFTILKDSLFNGKFDELEKLIRDYNGDGVVKMYDAFSFLKQALFN